MMIPNGYRETDIAIIGTAAHLPGAQSVTEFWDNLRAGRSAIRRLSEDELRAAGESAALMRRPNYVPFAAPLDGFAEFDAEFFGFSPKEAAILDPQHRQFLEVAWEAFEDAGHPPSLFAGPVGVFAGCGMGSYFYFNLCSNPDLVDDVGMFLLRHTGNDKDFLTTRVSHILDLKGPSVNVQTACSTSLVAIHYAVQSLLTGECDMALAGGVTLELPQGRGYLFRENEILSPDGACHAFDHRAQGTVFGSGAGAVVLRRLEDAIADGDRIIAVIRGTAINNDGAAKAGYLAPSVEGQARAIAEAHQVAGVSADTISYVECHGTGTYLGDPIEVAALTQAFRETTDATGFCRIGSVKTNIGHTDTAAGVASVIKVAQALHHRELPPSLGYEAPNPAIDFDTSPFRVNDRLTPWQGGVLRAGVNSLGVGGTNAHAVLQEAPAPVPSGESDWPFQPLVISARSKSALDQAARNLSAHLRAHSDQPLADVAFTLKEGRTPFAQRRIVVAESHAQGARLLDGIDPRRVFTHTALADPDVVFLFPGGGAQYAGMARDLYQTEPVFAEWMDRGLDHLQPQLDYDLRALWLPDGDTAQANEALKRPSIQLPLIMITEYALAQMFMAWGVTPAALVGHSMGENTAACLAGVMAFEDCIDLVLLRGQLFDTVPAGGMLSVPLSLADLRPYLTDDIDIASLNAPALTVVSGPDAALHALSERLAEAEITAQRVAINIAAHSRMLDRVLPAFRAKLAAMDLRVPQIPVISNRTGQPLTVAEATSPDYWTQHLRNTVLFGDCVTTLAARPNRIWLEMGPGKALSSLVRMHGDVPGQQVLSVLRHPDEDVADDIYHMETLARIWALGGQFDWAQIWGEARRNRVQLPTYPFQRSRYFIEPGHAAAPVQGLERLSDMADWGTQVTWKPAYADTALNALAGLSERWLVFVDDAGIASTVVNALRAAGQAVITVQAGDTYARKGADGYILPPEQGPAPYARLMQDLRARDHLPTRIAHFWGVTVRETYRPGSNFLHRNIEQGFLSLTHIAQALQSEDVALPLHMVAVTSGAQALPGERLIYPEKALITGPARVAPREMPGLTVATLDIDPTAKDLTEALLDELCATPATTTALLRGTKRYAQTLAPVALPDQIPDLPQGAHWVITGGLGGIGLTLAETLVRESGAKVTLIARRVPTVPDARIAQLGAQVLAADICNVVEMRVALDTAKASFGPIHGVIHAAGAIDDAPILSKTESDMEHVLAPKLHGVQVLDQLLADGDVAVMVLLSSTSTITAPVGQVDYVAANEYLNAYAASRRGGKTKVVALNWGIWQGAGMAAKAMAERLGDAPEQPIDLPLQDSLRRDGAGLRLSLHLPATHWLVDQHRMAATGAAIVPGTGYLDMAAQAVRAMGHDGAFSLQDLWFLRACNVPDGRARHLRTILRPESDGFALELRSDATLDGRAGYALNAQARVTLGAEKSQPLDLSAIRARCPNVTEGTGLPSPQEAHLAFGPRWRVLSRMAYGAGEGIAQLDLPEAFHDDLRAGHILHPALMDLATGWAMGLIAGYDGAQLWVPVSYERISVLGPLPARVHSHVRLGSGASTGFARFDMTLSDDMGRVLVEIEGFTIKQLDTAALGADAPLRASEMEFDAPKGAATLSPAEERLRDMLSLGITPAEGGAAFLRALATGLDRVVVSSIAPADLLAQVERDTVQPRKSGTTFERPDLGTDYIAPRNTLEQGLTEIWQSLLGIGQIGVRDNFFDLGGHSLIAVRLFAQVKKGWGADFPISALFQAPTIEGLAAMVAAQTGYTPEGAGASVTPLPQAPRYTHLVQMHAGDGQGLPFFMVSGMFGNVLNLRHLAMLLGADRPFYGLQAKGLLGDDAPHERVEDAAASMIAEIRAVQPQGPYCLGGFSGGGITAYEIAHQLEAAGEAVEIVVMLDTPLPVRPALSSKDKALIKLAELRRKGPGYIREWWQARQAWKAQVAAGPQADSDDAFHNAAIEAAFRKAVGQYQVQPWSGNLVLFRPPLDLHWQVSGGAWVSRQREYVQPDNDWTRFAPALRVIEVPGDHDSMVLEPNVRVLASALRPLLPAPCPLSKAAE